MAADRDQTTATVNRHPDWDGGTRVCSDSAPHEPHTWTLAAIDGDFYDCPGVKTTAADSRLPGPWWRSGDGRLVLAPHDLLASIVMPRGGFTPVDEAEASREMDANRG